MDSSQVHMSSAAALWAFRVLAAVTMFYIVNLIGDVSRSAGYVDFLKLYKSESFGLNVVYRTIAPPVLIGFLSIVLYRLGADALVADIWLTVLLYWFFRLTYYLIRSWWTLISRGLFITQALVSTAIAYYFYSYMLSVGESALFPDPKDVAFQYWMLVLGFMYVVLESRKPGESKNPPLDALRHRYYDLNAKFRSVLTPRFAQDPVLHALLFAFMLSEDFNRSSFIRVVERRLLPLGLAKTTGIMQVASDRALDDDESVRRAQLMIERIFDTWYQTELNAGTWDSEDEEGNTVAQPPIDEYPVGVGGYGYELSSLKYSVPSVDLYARYSGGKFSYVEDMFEMVLDERTSSYEADYVSVDVPMTIMPRVEDEQWEAAGVVSGGDVDLEPAG